MRKILTLMSLGIVGWMLAGCEQDTMQEPAEGLPENEAPGAEPDVQIGQGEPVEPGEPASPNLEEEIESELEEETDTGLGEPADQETGIGEPADQGAGAGEEPQPQN